MVGKQGGSGTLEKGGNRKVGGGQKRTLRRGVFKWGEGAYKEGAPDREAHGVCGTGAVNSCPAGVD